MLGRHFPVAGCLALCLSVLSVSSAAAQSRASNASAHASAEVPVAVYEALKASGEFVVDSITSTAQSTAVTVTIVGVGISFVLMLAADPEMSERSGPETSLGKVFETSGGLILKVGATVMAFIPDPSARAHIHSRKLS